MILNVESGPVYNSGFLRSADFVSNLCNLWYIRLFVDKVRMYRFADKILNDSITILSFFYSNHQLFNHPVGKFISAVNSRPIN